MHAQDEGHRFAARYDTLRHILVPDSCVALHFHCVECESVSFRIYAVPQHLVAEAAVPACLGQECPDCLGKFTAHVARPSVRDPDLRNLLLIDLGQLADSRREIYFIGVGICKCLPVRVILLLPVIANGCICTCILSPAHPDRNLNLCRVDGKLCLAGVFASCQDIGVQHRLLAKIAEACKAGPLAAHFHYRLLGDDCAVAEAHGIDIILHCDVCLACLNLHIYFIHVVSVRAGQIPGPVLRNEDVQKDFVFFRKCHPEALLKPLRCRCAGRRSDHETGLIVDEARCKVCVESPHGFSHLDGFLK